MIRELDDKLYKHINLLIERYPILKSIEQDIIDGYLLLEKCYVTGGKLLVAGNGGSASDAEHIVGELMKKFVKKRKIDEEFLNKLMYIDSERGSLLANSLESSLPAIALTCHSSLSTAYLNDVDGDLVFAQQLFGYGKEGDVFLGISTSGNSKNVMYASVVAKAMGVKILGLTGNLGGELSNISDVVVKVPEVETYKIQELHLPIYHCWCLMLEDRFF